MRSFTPPRRVGSAEACPHWSTASSSPNALASNHSLEMLMQEPDLSPILASEVKLLSKVMGLDLPPWRTFFQAHQGKRRQGDLRGLVVLKLKKAGISRSAIVRALGRNQSSVIEWERNALGRWDDRWKAYYDDRAALMAADPTEGIVSALNQLGVELLAAVKRDPVRFINECGVMLERLNQPVEHGNGR